MCFCSRKRAVHAASGDFFINEIGNIFGLDFCQREIVGNKSIFDGWRIAYRGAEREVVDEIGVVKSEAHIKECQPPSFRYVWCYNFIQDPIGISFWCTQSRHAWYLHTTCRYAHHA